MLLSAIALLALAFLVVLGPLIFATAVRYAGWLAPYSSMIDFLRVAAASAVLIFALVFVHKFLPAGHRGLSEIAPGVLFTLLGWLVAGEIFGRYLTAFASNYVTYYAGLASAMIALVFLYLTSTIFIFGGELNAAIRDARKTPAD